jgi:hypothetical protein
MIGKLGKAEAFGRKIVRSKGRKLAYDFDMVICENKLTP